MAELTALSHEKSLIDHIIALDKRIEVSTDPSADANFVADYFSKLAMKIQSAPVTSQQTNDTAQNDTSASVPKQSVAAPLAESAKSSDSDNAAPKYTHAIDERLPRTHGELVRKYQFANISVMKDLIKYGGYNHHPDLKDVVKLSYVGGQGEISTMVVGRETTLHYVDELHIRAGDYERLLDSMFRRRRSDVTTEQLKEQLRKTAASLDTAIAGRSTVHEWYELLHDDDVRKADNSKHAIWIAALKALRERMNRYL